MGKRAKMSPRRCARTLLNSFPKQLCRLMGRRLLMPCSFSESLSRGTITLVFHAAGNVEVRRQAENNEAMSLQRTGLFCSDSFQRPVETSSSPGDEIRGASESADSLSLASRVRSYHRSPTGLLIGVVLELSRGQRTLLVSAYMPSGLDHLAASSPLHDVADDLYATILKWAQGMQQVIRASAAAARAPAAAIPSPKHIDRLEREGFFDVYRHLHPLVAPPASPGFTHFVPNPPSSSRIDYLWCRGFHAASLLHARVDHTPSLGQLSHHRMLWMEMQPTHAIQAGCPDNLLRLRLPNLRAATPKHIQTHDKHLQRDMEQHQQRLHELVAYESNPDASLDAVASSVTTLVRRSAFACFPITGAASHKSRDMLQLERQRSAITRLLRLSSDMLLASSCSPSLLRRLRFVHCAEWRKLYTQCVEQLQLVWMLDAYDNANPGEWIKETHCMLSSVRSAIRQERLRMERSHRTPLEANPAAQVHRMLDSSELPAQIHAVIDSNGNLTSTAQELQDVLVDHFSSVFALPPPPPAPVPPPLHPPPMLYLKESIDPQWYDGLLDAITEQDILSPLSDALLTSSPGEDEVSTASPWKLSLQNSPFLICKLIASLFSACLRTSTFPAAWKTSVIVPLLKGALKEHGTTNFRPISLQSCLGKLFNKILAHRLGDIFARFPILHSAQRGFINGGSITKCIDELLDAWDWSRKGKHELHTLLYDIKQAYDSVQT